MRSTLLALAAAVTAAASAYATELPAAPRPSPGISHNCKPGIMRTSTAAASRLCARPLAMTIIEHHRHPELRT